MDSRVGRDQEVDIKELLYGIVKEWRLLLGVGCVCAVALGGSKAARSLSLQMSSAYEGQGETGYAEALLAYEDEKKGLEREIEDTLRGLVAQQEYLERSILMQISPYTKGIATAKLYVRAGQPQGGPPEGDVGHMSVLEMVMAGTGTLDGDAGRAGAVEDPLAGDAGSESAGGAATGAGLGREGVPDQVAGPGSEGAPDGGAGPGTEVRSDEARQPGGMDSSLPGPHPAADLHAGQMDALVQAYASSFKEDAVLARAVGKDGIDLRYVKELIQVETDKDSSILTVTVVHEDEESAKTLLESLLAAMKEKEEWLGQEIGANELVTVSEISDLVSDQVLRERQEEEEAQRLHMQESLKAEREELAALTEPKPFGISKREAVLLGIRYGFLGGVLGVFLAGLIACLRWLSCDRPSSAAEVEKRFGILELGTFKKEKKGAFRKVDHLLERLFGIEQAQEDEQVYQLIQMRVKTFYPEAARIYVAGLGPDTCKGKLAVRLRKAFPDREIHMGGSIHKDPVALQSAAGCDGVILVAEKDRSTYQEIRREAMAVERCRGRILGCVLV